MSGQWVKLHRKSIDSQVFSDAALWQMFCWCLMKANWKDGWFNAVPIPAGSFATGRHAASEFLGMNAATWYKRMKKLESCGVISLKSNNRFTVVTVEKWADYQESQEFGNNKVTTKSQQGNNGVTTGEQLGNTIEEGKESKEGKEDTASRVRVSKSKKEEWSIPDGVDPQHWADWLSHRKSKRASNTKTAWARVESEAKKAGWSLREVVKQCAEKPWVGFEAEWVLPKDAPVKQKVMSLEVLNMRGAS